MNTIAALVYVLDSSAFYSIRNLLGSTFLERNAGVFAHPGAWMPFAVFLMVWLYLSRPRSAAYSLTFGLFTFVLAYLAATMLANISLQPAPWWLEYRLHNFELPAMDLGSEVCLPDWTIAAYGALFHFSRLRMKGWEVPGTWLGWLPLLLLGVLRIYAGYSYPLGVLVGFLLAAFLGWIMHQLARNVEFLTPDQKS